MALTDYALNDFSNYLLTKYHYMSLGESDADSLLTNHTSLVAEVAALRTAVATSITNTYSTNPTYPDTAQFISIITNSTGSDKYLEEAGLQVAAYGAVTDHLGSRQTFSSWTIANGETVGIIWKIVPSRG